MKVIDLIKNSKQTSFSFEVLPPLKGNDIDKLFRIIDPLMEFKPLYINITSHRDELDYVKNKQGFYEKKVIRKRPGTVAASAAIMHKYKVNVVPHLVCGGFSKNETEYALIDLNFLGIHDLLVLKGDNTKKDKYPEMKEEINEYAIDLIRQINDLNIGKFLDGTEIEPFKTKFSYGVAGYPEKHEEAPNLKSDISYLKQKIEAGAEYIVTQMFFDNQKYYDFVDLCRKEGITVPIIPGIKPVTFKSQLTVLPQIFKCDIPEDFAKELRKCKNDEEVKVVGIEWCLLQAKNLAEHNVPVLHFYTLMAGNSVRKVAEAIF